MSVEQVVGAKAITVSEPPAAETSSMAPVAVVSEPTNDLTTISSKSDVKPTPIESNQSQSTLANEITSENATPDTTLTTATDESITAATVPRIQVPRKPDILQIYPSKELDVTNPNDMVADPTAPFTVVLAEGSKMENQDESKESNDIASTEDTVELKSTETTSVNTDTPIELETIEMKSTSETPQVSVETPKVEVTSESKTELGVTAMNTVETTSIESVATEAVTNAPESTESEPVEITTFQPDAINSEIIEPKSTATDAVESKVVEQKSLDEGVVAETVVPNSVEANSILPDEPEKIVSTPTVNTVEVKDENGTEESTESKAIATDAVDVNTFESKPTEPVPIEAETVELQTNALESNASEEPQSMNIESDTAKSDVVESETVQSVSQQPNVEQSETVKSETNESEPVEPKSVDQDAVKAVETATESVTEAVEPVTVDVNATESNVETVTEGMSAEKKELETTEESKTVESKVEPTTMASVDESKTTETMSSEATTTVDLESVEKSTQETKTESNVAESQTVHVEQAKMESESVESNPNQSDIIKPEVLEGKSGNSVDEVKINDSTSTEETPVKSEESEKSTEEPSPVTSVEPKLMTTETVPENVDATKSVQSEAIEGTTVMESSENITEEAEMTTAKVVDEVKTEKTVENVMATEKTIDVTENASEAQTTAVSQETEKMDKAAVTESVTEISTSNPTTELNAMKQLESSTELLINSQPPPTTTTTEKTNDTANVITTTVADVPDEIVPDVVLTMEASDLIEVRHNKRRQSNYQEGQQQSEVPNANGLSNATKLRLNRRRQSRRKPSVKNVTPNEMVATGEIPEQSISTQQSKPIDEEKSGSKSKSAIKIPSFKRRIEEDHKNHIIEMQSILSSLAKLPNRRPPFAKAKTLDELKAQELTLNLPMGNRNSAKLTYLAKNTAEVTSTTTEAIETSTQTERPRRKYNRRLPARTFDVGSVKSATKMITTTTTTTTTTELPNVSTSARKSFNRRRLHSKPKAMNVNRPTTVDVDVTTKPNHRLRNIHGKMSLEKRKQLFETRRKGNTATTTETSTSETPTTEASIRNVPEESKQLMDATTENSFSRIRFRTLSSQHRFKVSTEATTDSDGDDEITQPTE